VFVFLDSVIDPSFGNSFFISKSAIKLSRDFPATIIFHYGFMLNDTIDYPYGFFSVFEACVRSGFLIRRVWAFF